PALDEGGADPLATQLQTRDGEITGTLRRRRHDEKTTDGVGGGARDAPRERRRGLARIGGSPDADVADAARAGIDFQRTGPSIADLNGAGAREASALAHPQRAPPAERVPDGDRRGVDRGPEVERGARAQRERSSRAARCSQRKLSVDQAERALAHEHSLD